MLSEPQIQKLRATLQSSGWREVIVPSLRARANEAIKALVLHPSERGKDAADDGTLRARVQECEWMLAVFDNEITVFDLNRRRDELDRHDGADAPHGEPVRQD